MVATEIITTPNEWRAIRLAELVKGGRVIVRHTWTSVSGEPETVCTMHPEFQGTLWHERAYPRDVRATLEALAFHLHDDADLRAKAETVGITTESIQEMIDGQESEPSQV